MSVVSETVNDIKEVKAEIKEVKAEIDKLEDDIKKAKNDEEKNRLRDEKKQLRDEKKQLNDRLNMLMQQKQTPQNVTAEAALDEDQAHMKTFFEETKLPQLSMEKGNWIRDINILTWTRSPLKHMYWRSCYSYILCSVLGAFETACQAKISDEGNDTADAMPLSMVLTGVQGTGKSVLGAFLPLVFSEAGWRVTYRWGNTAHTFGGMASTKKITIWDTSEKGPSISAGSGFLLVVSSCNENRWHELAQQEVWSSQAGNYIFIDPVPKTEIVDMARGKGQKAVQNAAANYCIAGGVARLCQREQSVVTEQVDAGLSHFMTDLPGALKELNQLSDGVKTVAGGRKIYPGLLAHFQPTDPYRNQATLEVSSAYVKTRIQAVVEKQTDSEIQKLMQDLIPITKARGFAGLIWEPLFTRKSKKRTGRLVVVGSELPAKDKERQKLLDVEVGKVSHFEFKNVEDFKTKCTALLPDSTCVTVAMGKAIDDNYETIDGVEIIVERTQEVCVVAGLQLTVAQEHHHLVESGVLSLVEMADHIATLLPPSFTTKTEIWFLQPEECLCGMFNFVNLQPLSFDRPRQTAPVQQPKTKSGRPRTQPNRYGNLVADIPKESSNNCAYWDPRARNVTQRIAISRFDDSDQASGTQEGGTTIEKELKDALEKACSTNNHIANSVVEPKRRTRKSTDDALTTLRSLLNATLLSTIESDLLSEWSVIDDQAPQEETESMDIDE